MLPVMAKLRAMLKAEYGSSSDFMVLLEKDLKGIRILLTYVNIICCEIIYPFLTTCPYQPATVMTLKLH